MVNITAVAFGRGAWPNNGAGGTLKVDGKALGSYYRAPASGYTVKMPGLVGALAVRNDGTCSLDEYAVFKAVQSLQKNFGVTADGIFGNQTMAAAKAWQEKHPDLYADGIVGPSTAKAIYKPQVLKAAQAQDPAMANLGPIASGHIGWESTWDPGAVGYATPDDLGLGQINGLAHADMSVDDRLDPVKAIAWIVQFVDYNITSMNGVENDGIAAYNLGVGGARSWVKAGRPQYFNGVDVWKYISSVRAAM